MSISESVQGFIVSCDSNGSIDEVMMNHYSFIEKGTRLMQIIDKGSMPKFLSFLMQMKEQNSALNWEINFKVEDSFLSFILGGIQNKERLILFGTSDNGSTQKLYYEVMRINNEQTNQIRTTAKESQVNKREIAQQERLFNDLTALNNEMANMQRELAKKNHELKKLNEQLDLKNKELNQFAYIVSHDLKSPLAGLSSLVTLISKKHSASFDGNLKQAFSLIGKSSQRMHDLVNGILSYSLAGSTNNETSTFSLREMLDELTLTSPSAENFTFHYEEHLPHITGSYIQLSQVLSNLISNAVKYHHKGEGNIHIEVADKEDFIYLAVKDDGPGIDAKFHRKLFGIFETANEKSRQDSTGIGLAIVKKLVENHGGELGLISAPGEGSTFWFTWPKLTVTT
jgi:signal transduction histidine kinase